MFCCCTSIANRCSSARSCTPLMSSTARPTNRFMMSTVSSARNTTKKTAEIGCKRTRNKVNKDRRRLNKAKNRNRLKNLILFTGLGNANKEEKMCFYWKRNSRRSMREWRKRSDVRPRSWRCCRSCLVVMTCRRRRGRCTRVRQSSWRTSTTVTSARSRNDAKTKINK